MQRWILSLLLAVCGIEAVAQQPPYDVFPPADPPYYRVRYEASTEPGKLIFPVNYTIWIPPDTEIIRGVIVHQHGCGEGSCKSGLTGAYDLHWQALARKHDCALLAAAYEQPEGADCQMWCDPRNGSGDAFLKALRDLAHTSAHSELSDAPVALWGHSGGGHWAGGMVMLYPERIVAAWLRSGVPLLGADPKRETIKPHSVPKLALQVPIMCNPGTKEGVTVTDGRFAGVWPANETFFRQLRSQGGLIGVAIDPLTAHECGNQRYLAIPWLDACLTLRLPRQTGQALQLMPSADAWLAELKSTEALPSQAFKGDATQAVWLPNREIATLWQQYVTDTKVVDDTPPPAPTNVLLNGDQLSWEVEADIESGLAGFIVEQSGKEIGRVPEKPVNPFGRPLFQNLQYSDTPTQPLAKMTFRLPKSNEDSRLGISVIAINTVGLKSTAAPANTVNDNAAQ